MSASSHTRGHRYAAELTGGVLAWLESHGRRVVNDGRALQLEISKIAQYAALARYGIRTPRTIAAVGRDAIVEAARKRCPAPSSPSTTAPARASACGSSTASTRSTRYVDSAAFEDSVDGITLIQEYIDAPEPFITRVEFVGGNSSTRCASTRRSASSSAPRTCARSATRSARSARRRPRRPRRASASSTDFSHPIVERYRRFLADNGIGIAGIEFITDRNGEIYTYDVNTNTNYNSDAEREAGSTACARSRRTWATSCARSTGAAGERAAA